MNTKDKITWAIVIFVGISILIYSVEPKSRPIMDGAIKAGINGFANIINGETSTNNGEIETMETTQSGVQNNNNPTKAVTDTTKGNVGNRPGTSNKGVQEHNNAGILVSISQPLAMNIAFWIIISIAVIIGIIVVGIVLPYAINKLKSSESPISST